MNHNKEENYVGVSDYAFTSVLVLNLGPAYIDDIKSAVSEGNSKTTITEHSAYSPGVRFFTTDQLQ